MPPPGRFLPPWTIEENNNACFIVRDATGQALGYFYFEDEPGRRSAAKLLTRDEARRNSFEQFPRFVGGTYALAALMIFANCPFIALMNLNGLHGFCKPKTGRCEVSV